MAPSFLFVDYGWNKFRSLLKELFFPFDPSVVNVRWVEDVSPIFEQKGIGHLVPVFKMILPAHMVVSLRAVEMTGQCVTGNDGKMVG